MFLNLLAESPPKSSVLLIKTMLFQLNRTCSCDEGTRHPETRSRQMETLASRDSSSGSRRRGAWSEVTPPPPLPPPTSRALLPCNHVSLSMATFVISRRQPDVGRKQFHLMDGHKRGCIGWRGELCTTGRNRCPDRLLQIVPSPSLRHRVTSWLTVENFFFPGLLCSARGPIHSRATCSSS